MNILQKIARSIIKRSFDLSVRTIIHFSNKAIYEEQLEKLNALSDGTLGKDIADCLEEHQLKLVPNFESHDLKHVLLGFQMTPVDEIRMQAFMLGNGNFSIPSFTIFIFGALLLPELWKTFYKDYSKGRNARPIKSWTIEGYANFQTSTLRKFVFDYSREAKSRFNKYALLTFASYLAILSGISGMLYCLPFLFSSNMLDLVGAGFPFIGGAIIASAGLHSLSIMSR